MNRVYCHPRAYDLAFSYRDYPREVTKLIDWYKEATQTNQPPRTMLELACGPARYPIEFSRNGIGATGLDLSEDMCAYATLLAKDVSCVLHASPSAAGDLDQVLPLERVEELQPVVDSAYVLVDLQPHRLRRE